MISLVTITDGNNLDSLKRMLDSVKIATEIVIIYQGSDTDTYNQMSSLSDFCFKVTYKGNADLDRNFAYTLVTKPWILALDDDEWLPEETVKFISRICLSEADVVWFHFKNLVDSVDIKEILGDDPHPRLWRKMDGLISWPSQAHTHPQINSQKVYFTKKQIIHDRRYEDIVNRHELRKKMLDQLNVQREESFVQALNKVLKK